MSITQAGDSVYTWAMKPEEERAGLLLTMYILNLIILYKTQVLSLMTSSFVWPDSQTPSEVEPALGEVAVRFSAVSSTCMQVLAFPSLSEGEETTVWATEKRDQGPIVFWACALHQWLPLCKLPPASAALSVSLTCTYVYILFLLSYLDTCTLSNRCPPQPKPTNIVCSRCD